MKKLIKLMFFLIFCIMAFGYTVACLDVLKAVWQGVAEGRNRWLAVGFSAYFPIHFLFRRLIIVHVFGHELTHALWSLLFGGKIQEIYVSGKKGGFTTYTKGNFVVTLAPYFFPLYSLIFLLMCKIVQSRFQPVLMFFIGFSLAFHILLTLYSIRIGQSDLRKAGVMFSIAFVYLMNVLVIGLILCAVDDRLKAMDFVKHGMSILKMALPEIRTLLEKINIMET